MPFDAPRRVIDVSGDGPDSTSELIIQGTPGDVDRLRKTRDRLVAAGLVINGLPIFGDPRIRIISRPNTIGRCSFKICFKVYRSQNIQVAIARRRIFYKKRTGK